MQYRAALIGCGNIGSLYAEDPLIKGVYTHAGAYEACSKTKLVAICDINEPLAFKASKRWNVSAVYVDAQKMLQEKLPDLVSICTPDSTHAEMLSLVLAIPSVKAVLIEKPLALDILQAQQLIQHAKERDIILAINYSRRYSNGHQQVKQILESQTIGEIQKVNGFYTKGILHNGTHWLDLARWFLGEIKFAKGFYNNTQAYGDDPTLDAWIKFENGVSGFLQGLNADAFSLFEMDIIGTKGRVKLLNAGHKLEIFELAPSPHYSGYATLSKKYEQENDMTDTVLHAVNDLVEVLEKGGAPRCSGSDGLRALDVALTLIKSASEDI